MFAFSVIVKFRKIQFFWRRRKFCNTTRLGGVLQNITLLEARRLSNDAISSLIWKVLARSSDNSFSKFELFLDNFATNELSVLSPLCLIFLAGELAETLDSFVLIVFLVFSFFISFLLLEEFPFMFDQTTLGEFSVSK